MTTTANTIAAYAETATSKAHRQALAHFAELAAKGVANRLSAPDWAQDAMVDGSRVPVAVKVAHDGLTVDAWTSKSGKAMSRVHWADGTTTEYVGDLAHVYVAWNR